MSNLKHLILLAAFAFASPAFAQSYQFFGGMYGFGANGKLYHNPYTNAASCPAGYAAYKILGTDTIDFPLYYCGRTPSNSVAPVADFGGMFGFGSPSGYPNPITGGFNCPTGYTATQVLGSAGTDYSLFFCHKTGSSNPQYRLNGMWGGYWTGSFHADYPNPLTGGGSCPSGTTAAKTLGTLNIDYHVIPCFQTMY
ncbi:MAG TPA: hypothetical protein VEU33_31905 [Archangium sp.]|nr:hypothetical protein [Archangium sp.]